MVADVTVVEGTEWEQWKAENLEGSSGNSSDTGGNGSVTGEDAQQESFDAVDDRPTPTAPAVSRATN
jgi:hypothetical protein